MSRQDISEFLIHFTKDINLECAFRRLQNIVRDQILIAGDRFIKGGYKCVCFSEAPLSSLTNGLVSPKYYSAYSPFGILVSKTWLYQQGGRPVIYQTDNEFYLLSENVQWKHVRYEPPTVDFSWEREWRIRTDSLKFSSQTASIVVPNSYWADRLIGDHENEQEYNVWQYSTIFDNDIAQSFYKPFSWNIINLG